MISDFRNVGFCGNINLNEKETMFASEREKSVGPMVVECWTTVCDAITAFNRQRRNVSRYLGLTSKDQCAEHCEHEQFVRSFYVQIKCLSSSSVNTVESAMSK